MRWVMVWLGVVGLVIASGAEAQAPDLSALSEQLAKVRATHGVNTERDAGPELTQVKTTLRSWIEQQLPPVPGSKTADGRVYSLDPDDLTDLATHMSQALDKAGLTCGRYDTPNYRCAGTPNGQETDRAYVDRVRINRFDYDRYLMVVTGVGVVCGFDQSAYLYEAGADQHWHLLLSIEQDHYGDHYKPENFVSIDVSPSGKAWNEPASPPLVTTAGYQPWCSSNWNMLNTRLWRATPKTTKPAPLLDRDDDLYTGDDLIAAARLTAHELLVQFDGRSIDGDVLVRSHVLRYTIDDADRLRRIGPAALAPDAFVDEWLTSPWAEASAWLSPRANRAALARLHDQAYGHDLFGEFDPGARQCRKDPSLWQVSFSADGSPPTRPDYFLVRWMAPYDFTLVAAAKQPFAGCDKAVTLPSDIGTLFPIQGWTP